MKHLAPHLDVLLRDSAETCRNTQSYLYGGGQGHRGSFNGTKGKIGQTLEE